MTIIRLHHYQEKAFLSEKRIIAMVAGIQSGKTENGAHWIANKASKGKRGENVIICANTYKILMQATLPKFLGTYGHYGTYHKVDSVFKFHNGVTAFIRSLSDPNSIEGCTNVIGCWLDEGGLISKYAWDNVQGRTAFRQAQVMITTTPYALNWLFFLWESWKRGERDDVQFVEFTSKDNPYFPDEEFERQRRILDPRRFQMKYLGKFGEIEGLVYEDVQYCPSVVMPAGTRYFGGIDWGYTNPCAIVVRAITPAGTHYRIAEFYKTQMTIDEVVKVCKQRMQIYNIELFIGDPSAPANIESLNRGGVKCIAGNNEVRLGIDTQNTLFREGRFFIFEDDNPMGKDEYSTYHYPEPKDHKIDEDQKEPEPVKANDHGCDADRYVTMHLERAKPHLKARTAGDRNQPPDDLARRLEWLKRGGSDRFGT